jgi:hypothetical protein
MLNHARASLSNERSLEKHLSGRTLIRNANVNNKSKKKNELHEMIMKEQVQETMQSIIRQSHKHHCSDDDSDMDEAHHLEVMEDITVSECFNLSDLCQPPKKD